MFIFKIGSQLSIQIDPENMPPRKKLRSSAADAEAKNEKSISNIEPAINSDDDLGDDWREKCKDVVSSNKYALKKSILTDVKFIVGPEKKMCNAHRLILAMRSPVFEAMFYGGLAETRDTITIPDVSADGFSHLLRYLYSDDITFKDGEDAFKTYIAADKYCVTTLKDHCESYLCSCELTPANVWLFLESSLFMNSEAVTECCTTYLKKHAKAAVQHLNFLDTNAKTVETFLCLDNLEVSEVRLLQNLIYWGEHKTSEDEPEAFKNIMNPLLCYIRFGALEAKEFINLLETSRLKELLTISDTLAILKHIIQPTKCPLPDWCCTKTWRGSEVFLQKVLGNSSQDEIEVLYSRTHGVERGISKVRKWKCRPPYFSRSPPSSPSSSATSSTQRISSGTYISTSDSEN